MKTIASVLLFVAVIAFANAAPSVDIPTYTRISNSQKKRLEKEIIANGGCNANVCFAIDGSGSVGQAGFDAEKQFVFDIVSIINVDEPVEIAATQYGAANSAISPLTFNSADFNVALNGATFLNAGFTQIRGGLLYCFNQLRKRKGDANKIVLLGDGRANLGGNPVPIANLFRKRTGGQICAVGVRYQDTQSLLDIVGGDPKKVLTVDDFFELKDIIDELVVQICGL